MHLKKIIKIFSVFIIASSVFGYSYMEAEGIIAGPQVTISSPETGATVYNSLIYIEGQTKNSTRITLNGREIFIDEEGFFTERLLLYPGNNRITTRAYDRFDKEKEVTIEIVYKD